MDGFRGDSRPGPASDGVELSVELEHAIGYAGAVFDGLQYHPNGRDYVYAAGACVVVCDFTDPHNQHFLRGHSANVTCVAVSNGGRLVASGQSGEASDVIVWDYETRRLIYRFEEHDNGVACLAFSDDDQLLVTCGSAADKTIVVWDLSTGCIVARASQDPQPTLAVKFGGMVKDIKRRETSSYLIATSGNKGVTLWALEPMSGSLAPTRVTTGVGFSRDVSSLTFSSDREWLYGGTSSGDFVCINVKTSVLQASIYTCSGGVTSITEVCGTSGRATIVVGGGDGSVTVFSGSGKDLVDYSRRRFDGSVRAMSPSRDRTYLLVGTVQGTVWRVPVLLSSGGGDVPHEGDGAVLLCRNHGYKGPNLSEGVGSGAAASVSSVGGSGISDEVLKGVGARVAGINGVAYPLGVSDKFATAGEDNTVRIWDASDYTTPVHISIRGAGHPCGGVAYSLDFLLSGWEDGSLRCHNADNGESLWNIASAHRGGVSAMALSRNERFCVTGGVQGEVRLWEMRSRELVSDFKEHSLPVTQVLLYDDDVHAISCSRDKSFLCWDLRREKRISSHTQSMGGINAIALTPDQSLVISAGQDKRLTYWDLREKSPVQVIDPAHEVGAEVTCIAVAHNSDIMATGGTDHNIRIWDIRMGKALQDCAGHSGKVRGLRFSPDDKQMVSVGDDGCVFVWNVYA